MIWESFYLLFNSDEIVLLFLPNFSLKIWNLELLENDACLCSFLVSFVFLLSLLDLLLFISTNALDPWQSKDKGKLIKIDYFVFILN